ncbi:MAG: serine hydrolase [Deltaproteobacteria bacterium]|nr:serine hydrolase [Deltaproteobacteria bacterium]
MPRPRRTIDFSTLGRPPSRVRLAANIVRGVVAFSCLLSGLAISNPATATAPATGTSSGIAWQIGLQSDTVRVQRSFPGEIALWVKDLSTGQRYTFNAATPMYLASGIKLLVLAALFRQVEAGKIDLDQEVTYTPKDVRDGAPLLNYTRFGAKLSVRTLAEAMIQRSDNAATDLIIDKVGLEAVEQEIRNLELPNMGRITTLLDVRRLVYRSIDRRLANLSPIEIFELGVTRPLDARLDRVSERLGEPPGTFTVVDYVRAFDRYYAQGLNTAPIESMALFVEKLVAGQVVSQASSQAMLEIMLGTRTGRRRIRAGLPVGTDIAHKTGTQFRRICDFGLFFMPDHRPIVLIACIKGGRKARAEQVIAHLAQRTYFHLTPPSERRKIGPRPVLAPAGDGERGRGRTAGAPSNPSRRHGAEDDDVSSSGGVDDDVGVSDDDEESEEEIAEDELLTPTRRTGKKRNQGVDRDRIRNERRRHLRERRARPAPAPAPTTTDPVAPSPPVGPPT